MVAARRVPSQYGRVNIIFRWLKNHSSVPVSAGLEWQVWELGRDPVVPAWVSDVAFGPRAGGTVATEERRVLGEPLVLIPGPASLLQSCKGAPWNLDWPLESSGRGGVLGFLDFLGE